MDYISIFSIVFALVMGGLVGFICHYFSSRDTACKKSPKQEAEPNRLVGKINLAPLRGYQKFETQVEDDVADVTNSSGDDEDEHDKLPAEVDKDEQEEEEEEDQLNADRINATFGKLHGKLATAQLKAKTRQIAAEMSEEERDYERKIKDSQMASILSVMMQNQEKFGMSSDDIKEQMNLYNF